MQVHGRLEPVDVDLLDDRADQHLGQPHRAGGNGQREGTGWEGEHAQPELDYCAPPRAPGSPGCGCGHHGAPGLAGLSLSMCAEAPAAHGSGGAAPRG